MEVTLASCLLVESSISVKYEKFTRKWGEGEGEVGVVGSVQTLEPSPSSLNPPLRGVTRIAYQTL